MEAGYVYVLINPAFPGMVKIGRTARSPAERAAELSRATGVPTPFIVAFEQAFDDCHKAEAYVHTVLGAKGYRTSDNREFFDVSSTQAIAAILATPGKIETFSPALAANSDAGAPDTPYWKTLVDEAENHLYGLGSYLTDEKKAAQLLEKAVSLGGLTAYPLLSELYRTGRGVRKDTYHSVDLLRQGIAAGNPYCAWKLGVNYLLSLEEAGDTLQAQKIQNEANKCFQRWLTTMEELDVHWTEAPWYESSIPDSIPRDLFQVFNAGVTPDYLLPWMREYRESIIQLFKRMQDYAQRENNYPVLESWTNSLGRFQSAEL